MGSNWNHRWTRISTDVVNAKSLEKKKGNTDTDRQKSKYLTQNERKMISDM